MESINSGVALITTTGSGGLVANLRNLPAFSTQKSFLLLVYLVYNRGTIFPREHLAALFWPTAQVDVARRRLRTEIWRIKQYFDARLFNIAPYLLIRRNEFGVSGNIPVRLDVDQLKELDAQLGAGRDQRVIQGHLDLCPDLVLEQCSHCFLPYVYEDWAEDIRQQIRKKYLRCMEHIYQDYKRTGQWQRALEYARVMLKNDELDEHMHYEIMLCYLRCNMRSRAMKQYTECRRKLNQELGLSPVSAIENLYKDILSAHTHSLDSDVLVKKVGANEG